MLDEMPHRNALKFRIPVILKACARARSFRHGKAVHGFVIRTVRDDLASDLFVGAALVEMYSAAGDLRAAAAVFHSYPRQDVALWTAMISAYQKKSMAEEALSLFTNLLRVNPNPNPVTLIVVLAAVTQLGAPLAGKSIHGYVIRRAFSSYLPLANALLNMYCKLEDADYVGKLFSGMTSAGDVITWSCALGFYSRRGSSSEALRIYREMTAAGVSPNRVTIAGALQACAAAGELQAARILHQHAVRRGLELQAAVVTALIDAYMKCSCPQEAEIVFSRMSVKDVVSWSAMLGGYAQNRRSDKSFQTFREMLAAGSLPDAVAMAKLLSACSQTGLLRQAICLHGFIFRTGFERQPFVGSALVDFYFKCGAVGLAAAVFREVKEKDAAVWGAMIAGFGMNGLGGIALQMFDEMLGSSVGPTEATFVSLLSACSHSGLVREGKKIFMEMETVFRIAPGVDHAAAMVDLLGRAGELTEAVKLLEQMRSAASLKKLHAWKAVLAGCRIHGTLEVGQMAASILSELRVDCAVPPLPLHASSVRWGEMGMIKRVTMSTGKTPGISSIEVNGDIHWFLADDRTHQQIEKIHLVLGELEEVMREKSELVIIGWN